MKKIAVGSDHRGYEHKEAVAAALGRQGHKVVDCGCPGTDAADYPEPALRAGNLVADGHADGGVLICGSGIGMSIAANKVRGVRASLCFTATQARTTREHNDSNVLCLSGDALTPAEAVVVVEAWLRAEFAGGRHARRIDLITAYENEHLSRE